MTDLTLPLSLPVPPPEDPRNTWTERRVLDLLRKRHAKEYGNGPRYAYAEHVRSETGFGDGYRNRVRTADAVAIDLWPSSGNAIHGFEVKVSRADWLTELRDPSKADAIKQFCMHWWLVVPDVDIVRSDLPLGWGLLAVGSDGVLRVRKRAPRLFPKPVTYGFLASLARSLERTTLRGGAS